MSTADTPSPGMIATAAFGFDPFAADFLTDPHAHYHRARGADGLVRTAAGTMLATSYAACTALLRDPRLRCPRLTLPPDASPSARIWESMFLRMNPPDHTRSRGRISRQFTGRSLERLRGRISELTGAHLDRVVAAGESDIVAALAVPLPYRIICELIGIPRADRVGLLGSLAMLSRAVDPPGRSQPARTCG